MIVAHAAPGDVVGLCIVFVINGLMFPVSVNAYWRDRIRILVNRGVIVLAAAGNSGVNLSTAPQMDQASQEDIGCMLVGACDFTNGKRLGFSNYGHRSSVVNSWGHYVATTGYTDLFWQGSNRSYTRYYNGTSSALPLCTGAIALIQSASLRQGRAQDGWSARRIIQETGVLTGQGIGSRPEVLRAIRDGITVPPSLLNTQEQLSRLGEDPNGTWLAFLLSVHQQVDIVAHMGAWTPRIIFPAPSKVAIGRVIQVSSLAQLHMSLILGNTVVNVVHGDVFRLVSQGVTWDVRAGRS